MAGVPFNTVENESPLWSDSLTKINALVEAGKIDEAEAELLRSQVQSALLLSVQPALIITSNCCPTTPLQI